MAAQKVYDLAIIGAGPAALSAAVYTTREDISTVLLEKGAVGGLAAVTDWVDNYPGFSKGISGLDLAQELEAQAERFGAQIEYAEVKSISDDGETKVLSVVDGEDIRAKAVLIATGTDYKKLGVPGEAEYYARGVHYCATCDGAFYRDKRLVVVGGGNSGVQEALFLTRFATHIDLLVRTTVKASDILQRDLAKNDKITVHLNTTTDEIVGADKKVTKVLATKDGQKTEFETDGVFVFVGLKPNTAFLAGGPIKLDEFGFVMAGEDLLTTMPGVYVAGDVRSGATMQIATAVGEGATAALKIRHFLEQHSREYATIANQASA